MEPEILSDGEKWCVACEQFKPCEAFHRSRSTKDGYYNYCKTCRSRIQQEQYKRKPTDPEYQRQASLRRKFCITQKQYDTRFQAQGGVCACCGNPETRIDYRTKKPCY